MTNPANAVGLRPQPKEDIKFKTPKKGKLRIMPISDSPWAPTGFGTNTKNVSALLVQEGHHIGYGGCQNPAHDRYETEWPLGQTEEKDRMGKLTHYVSGPRTVW